MTAKEYLKQYSAIIRKINQKKEQKQVFLAAAYSCSSGEGSGGGAVHKGGDARFIKIMDRVFEVEKEQDELFEILVEKQKEIENVIRRVKNDTYRELLGYRYLCNYSWEKVADKMGYSEIHVKGFLHSNALKQVKIPT